MNQSNTKVILQYVLGVALFFSSFDLLSLSFKGVFGFMITMLGSLVCIPFTRKLIEHFLQFLFNRTIKYVIVILPIFSYGVFSNNDNTNENINTLVADTPREELNTDTHKALESFDEYGNNNEQNTLQKEEITTAASTHNPTINKVKKSANTTTPYKKKTSTKKKSNVKKKRKNSGSRIYITGPRGGCYYINSNGNKTYVDRSLCY